MAIKNQALTISYLAWNTSTNLGQTGDAANHTLRAVGDGSEFTPGESPVEADSTNLKGVYTLALQASEMNYNFVTIGGVSSTSNVVILPISIATERGSLPAAAPASPGGLIVIGTGAGEIEPDGTGKVTYANAAPPSAAAIATAVQTDVSDTLGADILAIKAQTDKLGFDGASNVKANAEVLPSQAPPGYGSTPSGGTTAITDLAGGSSRNPATQTVTNNVGQPISGALVTAYNAAAYLTNPATAPVLATTTSDANGHWTLNIITATGAVTLVVVAAGDQPTVVPSAFVV